MNSSLTNDHKILQDSVKKFVEREMAPIAYQADKECEIPNETALIKKLGALGLLGMKVPDKYSGSDAGSLSFVLALEQLSHAACSIEYLVLTNNNVAQAIIEYGNEEQKRKYVPPLCRGESVASLSFTEPATGSDPRALLCTVLPSPEGDYYVANGTKQFVSHTHLAGPCILFAKDDSGKVGTFIMDKNSHGCSLSKPWNLMGQHGQFVTNLNLDEVRIPKSNVLGDKGNGMAVLGSIMGGAKLGICAISLGLAEAALEEAIKYAKARTVRDKPIADMQIIQSHLVEMACRVEAARCLTYSIASLVDEGKPYLKEATIGKLFVPRMAVEVASMSLEVHGAYGLINDFKIERIYRNIKFAELLEGTPAVQRSIVAPFLIVNQ